MLVVPSIDVENAHSPLVHWPGASTGQGTPTDRPDRIAGRVAVPLQVAGGMQGPDSIRLAFAAVATPGAHCRVSLAQTRAAEPDRPGRRAGGPGVRRLVMSHGGARLDLAFLAEMARTTRAEIFVAGGSVDLDAIKGLRDAAIAGIILGEPLLPGAIDFAKALEAAS